MNRAKYLWFAAFTVVFAAMAAFVFWGTWSLDFVPVMPDCPTSHPMKAGWNVSQFFRGWLTTGIFAPDDLRHLTGTPYFWQELQYVIPLYLAGLAVAYYCRGRGLSRLASYGGGLMLSFSSYWMTLFSAGHLGWFQWMTYGVFAFGLADRAVRKNKPKSWILLGAVVGWASYHQQDLWLLFTVFTGIYFVWCCIRERKWPAWKGVLVAALAFAVIGAPGIKASFGAKEGREQQIAESKGKGQAPGTGKEKTEDEIKKERWEFITNWSLPADETSEFWTARLNGDTSCQLTLLLGGRAQTGVKPYTGALGRPLNAPAGNYRQHALYVGWVTCLLALCGLVFGSVFRRKEVWFLSGAAFVFWLLSLGRHCEGLYRCVFALPVGDLIRGPVKWHHLTELCLVFLAAHGLEGLLRFCKEKLFAGGKVPVAIPVALGALALIGIVDLVRVDRLYCAPLDVTGVRRLDASYSLAGIRRGLLSQPEPTVLKLHAELVPPGSADWLAEVPDFVEAVKKRLPADVPPEAVRYYAVMAARNSQFAAEFILRLRRENRLVTLCQVGNQNPKGQLFDDCLVEVLTPRRYPDAPPPYKVDKFGLAFGITALLGTLALAGYGLLLGLRSRRRRRAPADTGTGEPSGTLQAKVRSYER